MCSWVNYWQKGVQLRNEIIIICKVQDQEDVELRFSIWKPQFLFSLLSILKKTFVGLSKWIIFIHLPTHFLFYFHMAVGAHSLYFHRRQELSLNAHDPRCTWLHSQRWVTVSKPCWEIPPVYLSGMIDDTTHTHTLSPHMVEWVSFSTVCVCCFF